MSRAASATTLRAVAFGSGMAGLPPSAPFAAEVLALRFDVLLPRNAASFLVSFTPQT